MNVVGIDLSSWAADFVLIDIDGLQPPRWHHYPLTGPTAFDRARTVRDALPARTGGYWSDTIAIGIEDPRGQNAGAIYRIQGAILSCLPAGVLVHPWVPSQWRKAVGLAGNSSKLQVAEWAIVDLHKQGAEWTLRDNGQDCLDAYCIAQATLNALERIAA